MTAALAFPNGQTLAAWWRQLSARRPSALWVGYARVHRVEALAEVFRTQPLNPLGRLILAVFDIDRAAASVDSLTQSSREGRPVSLASVESSLGLDSSLVRRLLGQLEREGLIAPCARSEDSSAAWTLTVAGGKALELGGFPCGIRERRLFTFLESWSVPRQFRFVNLSCTEWGGLGPLSPPGTELPIFDLELLKSCIRESPAWKQLHGFPEEVKGIVPVNGAAASDALQDVWQRVPVDRVDSLCAVLSREAGELHAFAARPHGWALQAAQPCFSLPDGAWEPLFPDAVTDLPLEAWRQAWLNWGQTHNLPAAEMELCSLEHEGIVLRLLVGKRLMDRLQATRGGASTAENWLLAGSGGTRACARVEIVAT